MSVKNYFSIYNVPQKALRSLATPNKPHSFFQWLAMLFGVLIQPFFSYYKTHGKVIWELAYKNWEFLLFAVIVAVIAFPGIYKSAFDATKPKWIQMIPIFTAGLGWQTLVDSAVSAATKSADLSLLETSKELLTVLTQLV